MKKEFVFTYLTLILLTLTTAFIATSNAISALVVFLILAISAIKFLLIAFQFMELKNANIFWKSSLIIVLTIIFLLIWVYV